jgi:hypothetical protein
MANSKFLISQALLSGAVTPETCDEIAWLLEGGPANRTAYMAPAARRMAARIAAPAFDAPRPILRMTDALFPLNCGSRFD